MGVQYILLKLKWFKSEEGTFGCLFFVHKKLTILQKWRDPCILFNILFSLILFFLVKNLFASSTNNQKLLQQVP
ncbi:hypothetical protein CN971_32120 [Bacillus thuringiensis]|uniref:Uncharacterized protein n=1 Tax=Bacillus thuringiensis TaxID=1428 RepID=A0A9X7BM59_BACTU|nr:hypothetical protein COK99_20070 [Bacillus thuringiensis]PGN17264.1 hypothetical protein CN971_32120 [Bacillus thuringiensis]PGN26687.1 hypothetical protein CN969_06790 [Bacillus thuringiensis]